MVLHGSAGTPQTLQVARHRTGSINDHVVVTHELVERSKHLGLSRERTVPQVVATIGYLCPRFGLRTSEVAPFLRNAVAVKLLRQGRESLTRIGHQHLRTLLGGIKGPHIDVDERHVRIFKGRLRTGGEIGVPRADADDEVGLGRQRIR